MINIDTAFVPRDAGFFSVFNFYIGTIVSGSRSYPLFNKKELLKLHGKNEHFAYWTDNYNCWFDYFEPVEFYPGDDTHRTNKYLNLPRYCGDQSSEEFRIPTKTKALLKNDYQKFQEWRDFVHNIYIEKIKIQQSILNEIDNFWNSSFNTDINIIGVHYRHPSHFIESGKVYLEEYFNIIDAILSQHPDSKIFLASDSQFGIFAFLEKYGNKVCYIKDIDRLSMSEFLHWCFGLAEGSADHVGFINGKGYELHHSRIDRSDNKKMTIDLLKEVLCLSKCNQLINTISNISLAISYINPKIEMLTI